ncbi:MAG: exosome complex RNA-binding protein Csl4 [Candidatus Altiarchaeota archaeon]|nr:exosome complex RNA-binding protein Csl4 [Candidatus Altiarchaeota archaeon]
MDKTLIGDYLGTTEEYLAGDGTYTEDGKIYAAVIGEKIMDPDRHSVAVKGKPMPDIKPGQIVFGEVQGARKNMVNVIVSKIEGLKESIEFKTGLYVSNVSNSYVEKVEEMFGIGDIVKARILKIDNDLVDIETRGDFGVVKAFCRVCRTPLEKKDDINMECPSCKHKEKRKIAADYGNVAQL